MFMTLEEAIKVQHQTYNTQHNLQGCFQFDLSPSSSLLILCVLLFNVLFAKRFHLFLGADRGLGSRYRTTLAPRRTGLVFDFRL